MFSQREQVLTNGAGDERNEQVIINSKGKGFPTEDDLRRRNEQLSERSEDAHNNSQTERVNGGKRGPFIKAQGGEDDEYGGESGHNEGGQRLSIAQSQLGQVGLEGDADEGGDGVENGQAQDGETSGGARVQECAQRDAEGVVQHAGELVRLVVAHEGAKRGEHQGVERARGVSQTRKLGEEDEGDEGEREGAPGGVGEVSGQQGVEEAGKTVKTLSGEMEGVARGQRGGRCGGADGARHGREEGRRAVCLWERTAKAGGCCAEQRRAQV